MELREAVLGITGFNDWNFADKIKFFAWYLHTYKSVTAFAPAQISGCFKELNLSPPSQVTPFLGAMEKRRPKHVLRDSAGYRLETRVREHFDSQYGQRPATIAVSRLLQTLPQSVPDLVERSYLEEALICFRYKAFRAAVVMTWNIAYSHLCHYVLSGHLSAFNVQLPKSYPRAGITAIARIDDFAELKESQVVQVCKSALIVSDGVAKVLKEKLDRRNMAAHPSGISVNEATAEEVLRDLVENVILKLR